MPFPLLRLFICATGILACSTAMGEVYWNHNQSDGIAAGKEGNTPNRRKILYLCRGTYKDGLHPGKLLAGKCNIGWGGVEVVLTDFEVAHEKQQGRGQWGAPKPNFQDTLIGGKEVGNIPLYVCRAHFIEQGTGSQSTLAEKINRLSPRDRGVHPGKGYVKKCNIGYGGKEIILDAYEVFTLLVPPHLPQLRHRQSRSLSTKSNTPTEILSLTKHQLKFQTFHKAIDL